MNLKIRTTRYRFEMLGSEIQQNTWSVQIFLQVCIPPHHRLQQGNSTWTRVAHLSFLKFQQNNSISICIFSSIGLVPMVIMTIIKCYMQIPRPWQSNIGSKAARLADSCDAPTLFLKFLEKIVCSAKRYGMGLKKWMWR